jgi:hypothetical protein
MKEVFHWFVFVLVSPLDGFRSMTIGGFMVSQNVNVDLVPFFDSVKTPITVAGTSSKWNMGHKDMTLQVSGTATSFTAVVEGTVNTIAANSASLTDAECAWFPISVVALQGLTTIANISSAGLYEVGIGGLSRVRVNVTNIAGGNLTIVGALGAY